MVEVFLRLKGLSVTQYRDVLLATDEGGSLEGEIEYRNNSRGKGERTVDLKIDTERDMFASGSEKVPVLRDVPDKLWDLIGIYPRGESATTINEALDAIASGIRYIEHLSSDLSLARNEANSAALRRTAKAMKETLDRLSEALGRR